MLEDEQIRAFGACDPNKALVVVLNDSRDRRIVAEFYHDRSVAFDETFEIANFLKCLFRRTFRFPLLLHDYVYWPFRCFFLSGGASAGAGFFLAREDSEPGTIDIGALLFIAPGAESRDVSP